MTVTTKPGHRGEHEGNRKTIARGMPGDSGVTVVTNARAFYTTRAAAGAPGARHSLRPLISEGGTASTTRAQRSASRDRGIVSGVIARSKATKQSTLSLLGEMDCFASLAMTVLGPSPLFDVE
jgi:hypothetical protein